MKPVTVTMDLELWEDPENVKYLDELASKGVELFPVRRIASKNSLEGRNDFPLRVLFEMTTVCNAKCKMCPQMNLQRKIIHMDRDKYMAVIDELDRYGLDGLWLYHFGESLTHPNFEELVEYVGTKKNLGYIWLSTNGILARGPMIDFLLASSISFINFSLQSISVENYGKIAPKSPASRILENLQLFVEKKRERLGQKPFFRLQIIEQEHALGEIDTYLHTFYDKCDLISVNMLEHTDLKFNEGSKSLRERRERVQCLRVSRADCFINSDGSVAICDNAYNNQLDIGDIWQNSVYEIWNGPDRSKYLKMNEEGTLWELPLCSECTDYDL